MERSSFENILQNLDRETLAALLAKRAENDPDFVLWLEAELAVGAPNGLLAGARRIAVDPEPIRRQAEALPSGRNSRRRGWSDDVPAVDEDGIAALIDKARPFLDAGDGRNALKILGPVTEALAPAWLEQADWDETLHEFFPVLGQLIAEAVLMGDLAPEEQDRPDGSARRLAVLIVTKLDRLGRDAIDVSTTVGKLEELGVRVHCLALGGVDLASSAGKMTMNVINAVAQFERDLLIERTQSGLKRAKAEGITLGRPARLNETRKQDVLEGLANGMSVSALARKFETSRQTIMRVRDNSSRSVRP